MPSFKIIAKVIDVENDVDLKKHFCKLHIDRNGFVHHNNKVAEFPEDKESKAREIYDRCIKKGLIVKRSWKKDP